MQPQFDCMRVGLGTKLSPLFKIRLRQTKPGRMPELAVPEWSRVCRSDVFHVCLEHTAGVLASQRFHDVFAVKQQQVHDLTTQLCLTSAVVSMSSRIFSASHPRPLLTCCRLALAAHGKQASFAPTRLVSDLKRQKLPCLFTAKRRTSLGRSCRAQKVYK